jgi:FG-GAP-like repeat
MLTRILIATLLSGTTMTLGAQSTLSFELSRDTYQAQTNQALLTQVITGDFNNDGKPDYVVAGGAQPQDLVLRVGNGDGTFQTPRVIGTAEYPYIVDMAVADLNHDGKLDLVVVSNDESDNCICQSSTAAGVLQVFMGNGDGTFQTPQSYSTPATPFSVTVADFNGSGLQDIAVGDYNGQVEIWNNTGSGAFSLAKSVTIAPGSAVEVRAGQFDGDGIEHLAAAVGSVGVAIAWNDGQENFTRQWVDTTAGGTVMFMNVGQVAQDGRDDIILSYECPFPAEAEPPPCNTAIDVIYGQGDEKTVFRTVVTVPDGDYDGQLTGLPWAVDVNGDGFADLVTGDLTDDKPNGIQVWLANPDGSFSQTPISYNASTQTVDWNGTALSIAPADFNRDGMMDFVGVLPSDEQTEVYLNAGPRANCGYSEIPYTVTECKPVNDTYLTSPVTVSAGVSTPSQAGTEVTAFQEYVDGDLSSSTHDATMIQQFALSPGTHSLISKAWDQNGIVFLTGRNVTVYSGTPGAVCPTAQNAAAICLPSGSTSSSPVQILANGWTSNVPTAAQLYIDGDLVVNEKPCNIPGNSCEGTSYINTSQSLTSGTHDLVFKLWDNDGNEYSAQKTITVN